MDAWNMGGMGTCPNCGAPVMGDELYCMSCGAQLNMQQQPAQAGGAIGSCPMCGAEIYQGDLFCTACGADLSKGGAVPFTQFTTDNQQGGGAAGGYDMYGGAAGGGMAGGYDMYGGMAGGGYDMYGGMAGGGGTQVIGGDSGDPWGMGNNYTPAQQAPQDNWNTPPQQMPQDNWNTPYNQVDQYGQMPGSGAVAGQVVDDDDDDPTVQPKLVTISRDEANKGCRKQIRVGHETIEVDIPAGIDVTTKLDVPGMGRYDEMTGQRGPLRLSFYIV